MNLNIEPFSGFSEPDIAVILGSGFEIDESLGFKSLKRISFSEAGFSPRESVKGHNHEISLYTANGKHFLAFHGRLHRYEGYPFKDVCFPVDYSENLGCSRLLITSAAGGLTERVARGDLVVVDDHINLHESNPLFEIDPAIRKRPFQELNGVYKNSFSTILRNVSREISGEEKSGIIASLPGPVYETPAESRYLRRIGADMVSMSMVPEAIYAHYLGIEVAALAAVSNHHFADENHPDHNDILETVNSSAGRFNKILLRMLQRV